MNKKLRGRGAQMPDEKDWLTLKLDPEGHYVDIDSFGAAFDAFRKAVNGLTAGKKKPERVTWILVELEIGSALASVAPIGDSAIGAATVARGLRIVKALEAGEGIPPDATSETLEGLRLLAEIGERAKLTTSISYNNVKVVMTHQTIEHARRLLEQPIFEDFGTVEGRLEMVNLHEKIECHVFDSFSGAKIPAEFKQAEVERLGRALGRRVELRGRIFTTQKGRITRIVADELEIIEDSNLPTIDEMAGFSPDFTGGIPSEKYVRSLRDGEDE